MYRTVKCVVCKSEYVARAGQYTTCPYCRQQTTMWSDPDAAFGTKSPHLPIPSKPGGGSSRHHRASLTIRRGVC